MRGNAGLIGPFPWPEADTKTGVFGLQDAYNQRLGSYSTWPLSPGPAPTGVDTETSFVGTIPERLLVTTGSGDWVGAWDVSELQTTFTGTGRLYVAAKITGYPTYRNDIAIACIQILSADKTTLEESWHFDVSADQSAWASVYGHITGSSGGGITSSPSAASGWTYNTLGTSSSVYRWSLASYTSSSYTGMADGISTYYDSNIMGLGTNSMNQSSSSSYYVYREASGATRYSSSFMRSPSRTWAGGEWIRICYAISGPSNASIDYTDSIYVGTY